MAQLTLQITIPDGQQQAIIDDFAAAHGWTAQVENPDGSFSPNPYTRQEFARRTVARFIKDSLRAYRASQAAETARQQQQSAVDALNIS